jgi:hypothetical protein
VIRTLSVRRRHALRTTLTVAALLVLSACGRTADRAMPTEHRDPPVSASVPQSLPMGGAKSVTTFFVTSRGLGNGGNLGGVAGADAHCQALAEAEGSGDHTWRAYLSAGAGPRQAAINARDRIGKGPWYNAEGVLMAADIEQLHSENSTFNKETAVTERLDTVKGVGDTPNMQDMLTGSRPDGTAFPDGEDMTCRNWTSNSAGRARVGHHDRLGQGKNAHSWNSAHASEGCSQEALQSTGGAGLFYCFAID